jgi:hypothetical protein
MRWISVCCCALCIGLAPLPGHCSEARKLLQQAQLADARSAGGEPFRINATFALLDGEKQLADGRYELRTSVVFPE